MKMPVLLVPYKHDGMTYLAVAITQVNSITVTEASVSLAISTPAREGQANVSAALYLADILGVKKRQIELAIGSKSREKVFKVHGLDSTVALAKLMQASAHPC